MITKEVRIENRLGLHARAAALIVQTASRFRSQITIARAGVQADARQILALLLLAATPGSLVTLSADGVDEHQAISTVQTLIESRFHER
jgi:phosphocarrier protein